MVELSQKEDYAGKNGLTYEMIRMHGVKHIVIKNSNFRCSESKTLECTGVYIYSTLDDANITLENIEITILASGVPYKGSGGGALWISPYCNTSLITISNVYCKSFSAAETFTIYDGYNIMAKIDSSIFIAARMDTTTIWGRPFAFYNSDLGKAFSMDLSFTSCTFINEDSGGAIDSMIAFSQNGHEGTISFKQCVFENNRKDVPFLQNGYSYKTFSAMAKHLVSFEECLIVAGLNFSGFGEQRGCSNGIVTISHCNIECEQYFLDNINYGTNPPIYSITNSQIKCKTLIRERQRNMVARYIFNNCYLTNEEVEYSTQRTNEPELISGFPKEAKLLQFTNCVTIEDN